MGITKMNFHEAKEKYRIIFEDCFSCAENAFPAKGLSLKITRIDSQAINYYEEHRGGFSMDWKALFQRQLNARAKSITIAIWDGETLVGLALGKVSKARNLVSFSYIESNSNYCGGLSGQVITIVTLVGIEVGKHVNASYIALHDPVNTRVENYYTELGYKKCFLYGIRRSMFFKI